MNEPITIMNRILDDDLKVIVDIGAHIGQEIPWLKERWPKARIVAIEPNPDPFAELAEIEGIETYQLAITDKNGYLPFYPSTTFDGRKHSASSSLRKPKDHLKIFPGVLFGEPFTVEAMTLDDFCASHEVDHIDLLWMDVQGCEGDVIKGGKMMITYTRFIYSESFDCELYEGQKNRKQFLDSMPGHRLIHSDDYNVLMERK